MSKNRTSIEDDLIDDDIKAKFLVAAEACAGGGCTLPTSMELKIRVSNFCIKIILALLNLKVQPTVAAHSRALCV